MPQLPQVAPTPQIDASKRGRARNASGAARRKHYLYMQFPSDELTHTWIWLMHRYGVAAKVSPAALVTEKENPPWNEISPRKTSFPLQSHAPAYELVTATLSFCVSTTNASLKQAKRIQVRRP